MTQFIRTMTVLLGVSIGLLSVADTAAQAQTAPMAGKSIDRSAGIEASIVKAIGAETKTVKVTSSGKMLLVARVNSNMNGATHEGRNNEAKIIASLVAKEFASDSKFGNVSTIRVDYLARSTPGIKSEIVDSVEFRKGPDGVFEFHQT